MLRLVIVDDEPILLQGLVKTYEWDKMGFEVVGTARSGAEAIEVIKEKKPHVVLTDICMKQMSGLEVMETIEKSGMDCLFIVLSAYREFEYAKRACELGAFAYLLKPMDDEKLTETMQSAYKTCMEKIASSEKYESLENLVIRNSDGFLKNVVQKYVQEEITHEKAESVFGALEDVFSEEDRYLTLDVGTDLTYKITQSAEYEKNKKEILEKLEEKIGEQFLFWHFEEKDGHHVFVIRTQKPSAVRVVKDLVEQAKKEQNTPVIAAISKQYKGLAGIKKSYEEAERIFAMALKSGAGTFTMPDEGEERADRADSHEAESMVVNAVRKNEEKNLKEAFIHFIYALPQDESQQCQYIHKMMLQTEFMIEDTYGMTTGLGKLFQNYYSNMKNLNATQAVDVCYKILVQAIKERIECSTKNISTNSKDYLKDAEAYIEAHLDDEELTIVTVATQVYLNPVYFGRVFKNAYKMSFKKYLMKRRMERAKTLLQSGTESIATICDQVGINNPSYFSHLFKEYTGKLPSEYKKEYE